MTTNMVLGHCTSQIPWLKEPPRDAGDDDENCPLPSSRTFHTCSKNRPATQGMTTKLTNQRQHSTRLTLKEPPRDAGDDDSLALAYSVHSMKLKEPPRDAGDDDCSSRGRYPTARAGSKNRPATQGMTTAEVPRLDVPVVRAAQRTAPRRRG